MHFLVTGRSSPRRLLAVVLGLLAVAFGSVAVHAQSSPRADDPWLDELAAQLSGHFLPEGQLSLEWARARPAEATLPAELTLLGLPSALSPQLLLRVRVTTPTGPVEHTLVVRAQLWRDGWVVREPTTRGDAVALFALEPQRYDALRERDVVSATEDLDLVYSRAVTSGRLLTWRDVARRPLVRRGQLIEVAATDGPLTVTLRAVALADAGRGEVVRVRNPDSRKEFSAQVVGDARAQVRF